jgi:sugar phosphate isomerase/epimerase
VAAQVGYQFLGVRLLPAAPGGMAFPLMDDPGMLRETLARIEATGVGIFDLEIVRLNETFDARGLLPFFEVGAKLGARAVLVGCDDRDSARLAHSFAALCEAARPFGLTADIEFMPWTAVKKLGSAMELVEAAGRPANAGLLIDALHFARSASTLDDVRRVPREWLHYAQMCDAPAAIPATDDGLIHTARCERLLPGEGGIDLTSLFTALPADLPVSVEIPHDIRAPVLGALEWSRQALAATRRIIDKVQAARAARVPDERKD